MGIQDKMFDVEAALEVHGDKSALEDFTTLMNNYGHMEKQIEQKDLELHRIRSAFAVFKELLQ